MLTTVNCWVQVWLFAQRAGHSQHGAVCWDYHVFALQLRSSGTLVWDLDRSALLQMATPCSKLLDRDLMAVVPTSDLRWPGPTGSMKLKSNTCHLLSLQHAAAAVLY